MNLTNNVTEESYTQWIEKFVTDVLNKGNVKCKEVIIEDIESHTFVSRLVFQFFNMFY